MKSSKKSTIKKKYQTAGMVTPALPKSGPELTYPADVTYGQENVTGAFPTGQPLGEIFPIQFPDLQSKQLEPTTIAAPVSFGEISLGDKTTKEAKITPTQKPYSPKLDYNSMFTLGLGLTSGLLNQREEQRNRRLLNESIQQRQSQPLYDYNYMYGRTTSGGTEFQPIVKAEMGAQISKRYNTPNSINNVEIEGGEYLQLPDMSTEMAYGPSHSNGGIETSLPEGTRVYSNHLKPMGSKKTFAQMAKKYDNTEYDKILNNKFSKQVDKDTAMLMKQKNQKMLDKLFMDQQLMNGNSNGEPMAKNGASINNAGFRALPKAVQEKILSNMEYGGFSLPNSLYMQDGGNSWNYTPESWDAAMQQANQPSQDNWYTEAQWNAAVNQNNMSNSNDSSENWYNEAQWNAAVAQNNSNSLPNSQSKNNKPGKTTLSNLPNQGDKAEFQLYTTSYTPEGAKTPTGQSSYARSKTVQEYMQPWKGIIPNVEKMSEKDFQSAVYDYQLEKDPTAVANMWKEFGLTALGKKDKELLGLTKNGVFDEETLKDSQVLAKLKKAYVDGLAGARTLKPSTPSEQPQNTPKPNEPNFGRELTSKQKNKPKGSKYDDNVNIVDLGKYTKLAFPLDQAIPGVLGLAAAQETFPYAIPEVDSPYLRPQTLNIQSQLQDIDNMGQASVRAGADPLSAYIAGVGAKEKAFQTKQNFDAQGRMQADMFNAQAQQRSDMFNAQMFDRTYNQMIAQARDAATAEQQAAIANIQNNVAKYRQDENMKQYLHSIYAPSYNYNANTGEMTVVPGQPGFNTNNVSMDQLALLLDQARKANSKDSKQAKSKTSKKK